jgi:hypothetical protein
MNADRLARRGTTWRDSDWWTSEVEMFTRSQRQRRPHRTRWFRWEDELRQYASRLGWTSWQDVARRKDGAGKAMEWETHCEDFLKSVLKKEVII